MPSVTALRRWLVFVALLRLLSGEQSSPRFCASDTRNAHPFLVLHCRHEYFVKDMLHGSQCFMVITLLFCSLSRYF